MMEIQFTDKITVELVQYAGDDNMVLDAMLVSTGKDRGKNWIEEDPDGSFGRINYLMKNKHGSPFEHGMMTFFVEAPLTVFREWHRHRIGWSYNEISGRYVQLAPKFYVPNEERPITQSGKPGAYQFHPGDRNDIDFMQELIEKNAIEAYRFYETLLEQGIAKEVARNVLPVNTMSRMYATCNPRSMMAFLSLRRNKNLEGEAKFPSSPMWEIDEAAEQMENYFSRYWPLTYTAYIRNGRVCP